MDNDMVRILPALLVSSLLAPLGTCVLAADDAPVAPEPAASTPTPKKRMEIEGAIGPVFGVSPQYQGASKRNVTVTGGFFLRYGRYTISNTSAFVTRRKDDVFRGLGVDLKQSETIRTNLTLRFDHGRRSSNSEALHGLENVRETIRGRASLTRQFDHGNKGVVGWSPDLLGRGGGQTVDVGASHDRTIFPGFTWNIGGGLTWGDRRYMRSYYGVKPSETISSGYPAYEPGSGLRDVSVGTTWRLDVDKRWVGFWGGSVTHLLGPAADSPLTQRKTLWSLNGGIAWRF